jgi:hypothetical protein
MRYTMRMCPAAKAEHADVAVKVRASVHKRLRRYFADSELNTFDSAIDQLLKGQGY